MPPVHKIQLLCICWPVSLIVCQEVISLGQESFFFRSGARVVVLFRPLLLLFRMLMLLFRPLLVTVRMLKLVFRTMLVVVRIFFMDYQNAGPSNVQDSEIYCQGMRKLMFRPTFLMLGMQVLLIRSLLFISGCWCCCSGL